MKNNKYIVISLSIGILISTLLPAIKIPAKESDINNVKLESNESYIKNKISTVGKPKEFVGKDKQYSADIVRDKSYFGSLNTPEEITKSKLEELVKEGYSAQDILIADDLAKKHRKSVEEILSMKKDKLLTFDSIDNQLSELSVETQYNELKIKFPSEYSKLEKTTLSMSEKSDLLSLFSNYQDENINNLIDDYQKDGQAAIISVLKTKKINRKPTASKVKELGLSSTEAQEYTDEMLVQLEKTAKSKKITVKELIIKIKSREKEVIKIKQDNEKKIKKEKEHDK